MANLREIRLRIKSVEETKKLTNAMHLISSSKLKKAKKSLEQTLPYFERMQTTMESIVSHMPSFTHKYFAEGREIKDREVKRLYVVISGDKGMCGGYNHNIINYAEELIEDSENNTVLLVGAKGKKYFKNKNINIVDDFIYAIHRPTTVGATHISNRIIELYNDEEIDEAYVVYTKMITSIKIVPEVIQLLPLQHETFNDENSQKFIAAFTPSLESVMNTMVPTFIKGIVFGALMESFSSEQSARMIAMDSSTTNATKMLASLTLEYNRARQASITQQISEVASSRFIK